METNINWQRIQSDFHRELMVLPQKMGTVCVNFFKQRFLAQAWTDQSAVPWTQRKPNKRNNGRAILIKSGRLRNSIHIINSTAGSVTVGTDVPYAEIHNEGFNGVEQVSGFTRKRFQKSMVQSTEVFNIKSRQGRRSTVKNEIGESNVRSFSRHMIMPKRQFIGNSQLLRHKLEQLIEKELKQIFKS